ncbi:hypothetical protein [Sulfuriferula sp.]|uniref:hypothetical protein n=1 Tax=Sulfuriferula sp. TaxID=2025307 RepID=UPI0027311CBD|nr:hypothetical protein [Sulfuriferula sp.]MDP2025434.1 hypothetical protein [Sulfuriferula sp.]
MKKSTAFIWLGLAVVWLGMLAVLHDRFEAQGVRIADLQWSYAIGYAILAVLLVGGIARLRVTQLAPVWRMLALLGTTALAALEIKLQGHAYSDFMSLLAAAVVGAAAVTLLAKYLPRKIINSWLALKERA